MFKGYVALLSVLSLLNSSNAQEIMNEETLSSHRQLQNRRDSYQIYWYDERQRFCQKSQKFNFFNEAYNELKKQWTNRSSVFMINNPYIFNRKGSPQDIQRCIRQAQDNGDLERERQPGQGPVAQFQRNRIPNEVASEYQGPPYFLGKLEAYKVVDQKTIEQMQDNFLARQVRSNMMCKRAFPVKNRVKNVLECAGEIINESKKGYCGVGWEIHGTFQYGVVDRKTSSGRLIDNTFRCGCCQLSGGRNQFVPSDYVSGADQYDVFEIKDKSYMAQVQIDKRNQGTVKVPEPFVVNRAGSGFVIWYYTDPKKLNVKVINQLTENKNNVPQGACNKTPEYNDSRENLEKVVAKFNSLADYDKVLTYRGKVIYTFGYSNDFIYCILWGQSTRGIDQSQNYYVPEHNCAGRWDSILGYYNCKEKERTIQYNNVFKANRYISPKNYRTDKLLSVQEVEKLMG